MLELFKLVGKVLIQNEDALAGLDETQEKAKETSEEISKSNKKTDDSNKQSASWWQKLRGIVNTDGGSIIASLKKIGTAVIAAFSVKAIINFGKAIIQAAADASAASAQFSSVFGDLEADAKKSLTSIAKESGIVENRLKGSFTQIAAFAKTAGMDQAEALALSERAMKAVADSAAFYDRSLEDTTDSLQSFLKGNYENDAALGLSATETTRNAAANKLYGKSFKDLSESQKQLTLLRMVEEANALSGALGQAARESDTWSNQTGNLKQAWTDFMAVLGDNFLVPAVMAVKGVTTVVVELTGKIPIVIGWFKSLYDSASVYFPAIQQTFLWLWDAAQVVWQTIGQPLFNIMLTMIDSLKSIYEQYMPEIASFVSACFQDIQMMWEEHLKPCFEAIGNFISTVLAPLFDFVFNTLIRGFIDTAFNEIKRLWEYTLKPIFTGIIDFLTGVFTLNWSQALTGVLNIVIGIFNSIRLAVAKPMELVKNIVNEAIEFIKDKFNFEWRLPHIALPHFSISGGFSLNPPSIPHFSVDWYAKAMNTPMLLKEPTIFGFDPVTGKARGGGEAGTEVVSGANTLMSMIQAAVGINNEAMIAVLYKILEAIITMDENMGGNLREALDGMSFDVNKREFARLVKGVT